MKTTIVVLVLLLSAGCVSTGPVTSRPAIQRHVGTQMSAPFPLVLVENEAGERRLVEKNIFNNRVVAHVHPNEQIDVIGAKYRRWPLQHYYYLELRLVRDSKEIPFDVRVDRYGKPLFAPIR